MYFEDGSIYDYKLKHPFTLIKNIGWLDSKHPYTQGSVSEEFLMKLSSVLFKRGSCEPTFNIIRGTHRCNLCNETEVCIYQSQSGNSKRLGGSEILIPNVVGEGYFASPSMIYHYIAKHSYMPPRDYIDSVLNFDLTQQFNAEELYTKLVDDSYNNK
ncbi:hypothetical protein [Kangiella marina]|uniref:DUF7919 domain-containing protein n=1 Tax=Kangiella marina TaxID=1079178 RepID=A0ABP8IAS2_9GAMM